MAIYIGVAGEKSERPYKDATDWFLGDGNKFIDILKDGKVIISLNADAVLSIRKGE